MVEQVGGDHYVAEYQHWDMVADTQLGYFEANATKYISRWRKKNGVQDLKKGISYLEKIIQLDGRYRNRSLFVKHNVIDFFKWIINRSLFVKHNAVAIDFFFKWISNVDLSEEEIHICKIICHWRNHTDLREAIFRIHVLATQTLAAPYPVPPTGVLIAAAGGLQHGTTGQGSSATIGMDHPFGYDEEQENGK